MSSNFNLKQPSSLPKQHTVQFSFNSRTKMTRYISDLLFQLIENFDFFTTYILSLKTEITVSLLILMLLLCIGFLFVILILLLDNRNTPVCIVCRNRIANENR